jgi:hypothetical protein
MSIAARLAKIENLVLMIYLLLWSGLRLWATARTISLKEGARRIPLRE